MTNVVPVPSNDPTIGPGGTYEDLPVKELYRRESARIQQKFEETRHGPAVLEARTALVDDVIQRLWNTHLASAYPKGVGVVAIGGYGRSSLFPHSDIDLLFLCEKPETPDLKAKIRALCQELWDMRMRLSPTTKTVDDCSKFDSNNAEGTIALMDARYVAGEAQLPEFLRGKILPATIVSESHTILEQLIEVNNERKAKYSNTIFHLEPDLKDCVGGLRDYHLGCWAAQIHGLIKEGTWIDPMEYLPKSLRGQTERAVEFLDSVRCFLHYRSGRDDNKLSWDAQEEAAKLGMGDQAATAAEWMRSYFRHARVLDRFAGTMIENAASQKPTLFKQIQNWRSRASNADFTVVNGRVRLQQPGAIDDPDVMMRSFEFVAEHGVPLSASVEHKIEENLPQVAKNELPVIDWWRHLGSILIRPHAGAALRAMQRVGLLNVIFPEFANIESLVLRDLYHQYTVDEHTFIAIDALHQLSDSQSEVESRFLALLDEIEQPELLVLAILLHDIGKGIESDDHVKTGVELARKRLETVGITHRDAETVCFLIAAHLEASLAMRRDIFDIANIRDLANRVGTQDRLKMLILLTYADIKAVNRHALTPWKADNLWQLYIATANFLSHSVDEERYHANAEDEQLGRIRLLAPQLGKKLKRFLEGIPQRYMSIHSAEEIAAHIEMASKVSGSGVQLKLNRQGQLFLLTVAMQDRPMIFCNIAGALAAWGMNIVKADAFANGAGMVLDTFYFADQFRTLELNMEEWTRFQESITDVLSGKVSLETLMKRRRNDVKGPKATIETKLLFDDQCSSRSTLLEVVTPDRPGLLYEISAELAKLTCNIEAALIDTEGRTAIDVFYLTHQGKKLEKTLQEKLQKALAATMATSRG
ncbi:UTP-GlnB (protein PII) uridylyltransferase, GlnD [Candidatus Koribacter versatilis Ellin345]|uniref:Bifunctional uridylyltransferase/uridylyl-removing enzyme n=1 Tax=Koribacter versatilis (strain Ellin345) TaxID=204669 RepID=Q1IRL0_KORVE|nr:[protein-PII] uridylyltransferase [Candidatus Koribacter versatilis]ABF40490.1 UTP-GlnB (protein PII) uridylyltransferase, GlnD [Candidatus Koribacter versatilis Ellin345]